MVTKDEIRELLDNLKPVIDSDYRVEGQDDDTPTMCVIIGVSDVSDDWSWQTGDPSFMGDAYHYPLWATIYLQRSSDTEDLAAAAIDELLEQFN